MQSLVLQRKHMLDVIAEAQRRQTAFRLAGGGLCNDHSEQADETGICMNCGIPVIGPPEPSIRGGSPVEISDFAIGMICGAILTLGCAALAYPFIT